ncbi:MAG: GNAT family N-acetyltransferase [Candidatus Heimdallarchaeota archaeon]|nr:GNAT family N-acetyltransferase [Candidatus Heimdallarchaeota archaeon]
MNTTLPENAQTYHIVQAEKTDIDANHYAILAEIAADGFFSFLYGSKSYSLLKRLFLQENTIPSYEITSFAKSDGIVLGKITAYSYEYHFQNNKTSENKISDLLGWRIIRLLFALFVLKLMRINLKGVEPNEFYIESIAIYEEYRGRKLSKLLLEHVKKLAIQNKCSKLSLDVDKKNTIAIAAYEKYGFEILEQTKNKKIVKMVLEIHT